MPQKIYKVHHLTYFSLEKNKIHHDSSYTMTSVWQITFITLCKALYIPVVSNNNNNFTIYNLYKYKQ